MACLRWMLVLAACACAGAWAQEPDWSALVDELLVQTRQHIQAEGRDEVPIPNIDKSFEKKVGFIKAHGSFEAWDGRVGSLASIQRTGPVTFTSDPGRSVTLEAHLGFGTVVARYHYKAEIWGAGPRGSIRASVGHNSVRLRLRADLHDEAGARTCTLALEEAAVLDMGGFDVDISGLGPLDWLASRIVTWVANERRGDIMANTQSALHRGLSGALGKVNCDPSYISL